MIDDIRTEGLRQAAGTAAKILRALSEERDARRFDMMRAEEKRIDAELRAEYGERLNNARLAASDAARALTEAVEAKAVTGAGCSVPLGTRLALGRRRRSRMTLTVVVTKDRNPRSFRWGLRPGVNQPNALPLSRATSHAGARRDAERVFGELQWVDAENAGVDERNAYVVQVAKIEILAPDSATGEAFQVEQEIERREEEEYEKEAMA